MKKVLGRSFFVWVLVGVCVTIFSKLIDIVFNLKWVYIEIFFKNFVAVIISMWFIWVGIFATFIYWFIRFLYHLHRDIEVIKKDLSVLKTNLSALRENVEGHYRNHK